jgi:hypothetical protein
MDGGILMEAHGTCPEVEGCPLCNTGRWSLKLYDAMQPLRDLMKEFPELEGPIVTELGNAFTNSFAGNFYTRMEP